MKAFTIIVLFVVLSSCKTSDSQLKRELQITLPDGSVENPDKVNIDKIKFEIYSGDQDLFRIYFIQEDNQNGFYFTKKDGPNANKLLPAQVVYLLGGVPYNQDIPTWLGSAFDKSTNSFIEGEYTLFALAPTNLSAKGVPLKEGIRGLNYYGSGKPTQKFKVGSKDESFKLSIDLQGNAPKIVFDFIPMSYGYKIDNYGAYGINTKLGVTFNCEAGYTSIPTTLKVHSYDPRMSSISDEDVFKANVQKLNAVSLEGKNCEDIMVVLNKEASGTSLSLDLLPIRDPKATAEEEPEPTIKQVVFKLKY